MSAVPTTAAPARKSTLLTVAPLGAVAVALRVGDVPNATESPLEGAVRDTVGTADVATVTVTAEDITVAEFESVTRAVNV